MVTRDIKSEFFNLLAAALLERKKNECRSQSLMMMMMMNVLKRTCASPQAEASPPEDGAIADHRH